MKTFFLKFDVIPTAMNKEHGIVHKVIALCWIKALESETAVREASFTVKRHEWEVKSINTPPKEVTRENFFTKDLGLECYDRCQMEGFALVCIGASIDGVTTRGPIQLELQSTVRYSDFLQAVKKQQDAGRCLHFDATPKCNSFIKAHSIQKRGMLSKIARDGHVYSVSLNLRDLKKHFGMPSYILTGINKASTFLGFCDRHDAELFKPIDTLDIVPTQEQVYLYAYRSICRELFAKENAVNVYREQLDSRKLDPTFADLIQLMLKGSEHGLRQLKRHKLKFDLDLRQGDFGQIQYALFICKSPPNMAFSSSIYPDYDFLSNPLQDLADERNELDLIAFNSVPMREGWGFLIAWHKTSSRTAKKFIASLVHVIRGSGRAEDALFRLAISSENHAFNPAWWEGLSEGSKLEVSKALSQGGTIHAGVSSNYLSSGLEGISGWSFSSVVDDIEN